MGDDHECPACPRSFDTERGMKVHFYQIHDESIAGRTVTCEWCGTTFAKPPGKVAQSNHDFCSTDCRDAWFGAHPERLVGDTP